MSQNRPIGGRAIRNGLSREARRRATGHVPADELLVNHGLTGVLDWSLAGVGDPACDIAVAWTLFDGDARFAFRSATGTDDAAWDRGRGWALIEGVLALSYYRSLNVELADGGRRVIDRVLAD